MEILTGIIYGAVQGATEFLPVSSSGHLVILHELWPFLEDGELAFDIFLHLGTLLAVAVFLWPDLWRLISALIRPAAWPEKRNELRTIGLIVVSAVPAGIAGVFLEPVFESWRDPRIVAANLAVFGLIMLWADRKGREGGIASLSYKAALLIGAAQALALVPGVSRSGITIIAGLLAGLKRTEAVRFSFLASIPVIAGAGGLGLLDLADAGLDANVFTIVAVAGLTAAFSGYLAVRYLLAYVARHDFRPFVWYRLALAALIALWLGR